MMYAVLSLGLALLGGIVRLAQVLRLSAPLLYGALVITVFRPWYLAHTALADGIFLVLVRTPLCKISSTGEIEQRFRLN